MITKQGRNTGHWIYLDGRIHCDVCERIPISRIVVRDQVLYEIPKITELMKYCPNCGAKMENLHYI